MSTGSDAVPSAVLGIESRGTRPGAVRTLGEIALRVNDLEVMRAFYERVVGLELMREFRGIAFFRLGEGYGGHTTVLALFDRDTSVGPERTTLDHIALTIDIADYEPEQKRLESAGLKVRPVVFDWVGWRSLFFRDPEGNSLEFVCRDPELNPQ